MRVLIVEDERRLAQTLADLMEAHNYGADIAYDGEEGLDNALSGIYDVILLDVMLPKRSGYEIVHALRKEGDKTPVLMLTARTEVEDRINGLDSGADYYLTKPFDLSALLWRAVSTAEQKGVCYDGKADGQQRQGGDQGAAAPLRMGL